MKGDKYIPPHQRNQEKSYETSLINDQKKAEDLFIKSSERKIDNKEWKTNLFNLKDNFLKISLYKLQKQGRDEEKYSFYLEKLNPSIETLAKTFLKAPIKLNLVKYIAIQIFEEVLYKVENLPDILKATFFYHMANFNCQHEHDSWRSSVYSNALINLSKKHPDSQELALLSNKVQKIDEYSQEGLRRFADQRIEQKDSSVRKFNIKNSDTDIFSAGLETKDSALSWTKPQDFSIITGKNGAGKSAMLNSLQDFYRTRLLGKEDSEPYYSLYMRSEELGGRLVHGENSYDFRYPFVIEDLDGYLAFDKQIKTTEHSIDRTKIGERVAKNPNSRLAVAIADRIFVGELKRNEVISEKALEIAEYLFFSQNSLCEPSTLVENIFKQYMSLFINDLFDNTASFTRFIETKIREENSKDFKTEIEHLLGTKFIKEWTEKYDRVAAEIKEKLNKFAFYINQNRDKFYNLCEEYQQQQWPEISSPFSIIIKLNKYFDNYKIGYSWIADHQSDNYLKYVTSIPQELEKNIIYLYEEDGNLRYQKIGHTSPGTISSGLIKTNQDGSVTTSSQTNIFLEISKQGNIPLGKFRITFSKDSKPLDIYTLSSGELMIFKLMLWSYASKGLDFGSRSLESSPSKVKLLLLDEIDRHLDPKLVTSMMNLITGEFYKNNVKIIMTTHRPDTLALAPQEAKIFTAQPNDKNEALTEIVETHPLLAMFRLTENLRKITGHHHVVYTESRNDALFYDIVYKTLMGYCEDLRINNKIADWQITDSPLEYLLSRRSQFSFMSSSLEKEASGGCTRVLDYIASDIVAFKNHQRYKDIKSKTKNSKQNIFYNDIRLCGAYGILDNDYENNHDFIMIGKAIEIEPQKQKEYGKERAIVSERHSLENYVFDPFIFAFIYDDELTSEMDIFYDNTKTKILSGTAKNQEKEEKRKASIERIDNGKTLQPSIKSILLELRQAIITEEPGEEIKINNSIDQQSLQRIVNKYFEALLNCLENLKETDQKNIKTSEIIKQIKAGNIKKKTEQIIIGNQILKIDYPECIINVQGHALADSLFGNSEVAKKVATEVIRKMHYNDLICIPFSLAEIFFKLNFNLRKHVRELLKPDQKILTWPEKIDIKKAAKQPAALTDQSTSAAAAAEDSNADSDDDMPSLENVEISEKDQTVNLLYSITPTNPLLSIANFIPTVRKIAGSMEGVNNLIALGEDSEISESIKSAINERGIETVINLLLTKNEEVKQNIPLLEDENAQNIPEYNVNSNAAAALVTLDIIESAPTIKYFIKDILQLDVELPKLSNYIWMSTHFILGSIGAVLLPTNYPIMEKIAFVGMNSINYGARIQLYESADKIGILPTIAGQMLLTFAKHHSAPICSYKATLYDLAITASIGGMQYYQNYFNDLSREKTLIETIIPYGADIITLVFASQNINLPNGDPISYIYFAKELLATTSAIVMTDYASKTLLNLISNNAKIIYDYFSTNDSNSIDLAGNTNNPILE